MKNYALTTIAFIIAVLVVFAAYFSREEETTPTPIKTPIKVTSHATTSTENLPIAKTTRTNKEVAKVLLSSTKLREIENKDTDSELTYILYEDMYGHLYENPLPHNEPATSTEQRLQVEGKHNFTLATSTKDSFCQFPENKTHIGLSPLRTYVWLSRTCYEGIATSVFEVSTGKKIETGDGLWFEWDEDESVLLKVVHSSPFTSQESTDFYVSKTGRFDDLVLVFRLEREDLNMSNFEIDSTGFSFDSGKYINGVFTKERHYKYSLEGQELVSE